MIVRLLPVVLLGLSVFQVQAAPMQEKTGVSANDYSVDLLALYHESRLEDPRIISAYAKARSASEQQRAALGGLLPQVSANGGYNRILRKDDASREIYDNSNYGLSLTQYIYNKQAWESWQKSKSVSRQKVSEADEAQAEATVDLAKRYFVALAADDDLELVMAERRATQKNLDQVNALYARHMAKITDQLDLQARVDSLAAQEVESRNQVRLSRAALAELVGRPINERLSRVRSDVEFQAPMESLDNWLQLAESGNPALKASQSGVEAAEAAVREGKGGHYPSLTFSLSGQQSDVGYDNTQTPRSDSYVATLGVKVPLYSGGSTSARVRGLYDDQQVAEEQMEGVRRQVVKETTNAYLTAQSSVEKIRASRNALSSASQSSIAAQKAFTYGVVNAVDVLASVQNEFKARRDLLKAQYDFVISLFALNRWAGKLSEGSVASVNAWLSAGDINVIRPDAPNPKQVSR
ncbi:TolC family outer membrane protein [Pseudomonas umsongensis]|uniref:TolC family outer membrane protein n=1 Tax=Pseudomonas umsongensis TaxID=198618 RepID=A0AAE6ZU89_9PSED|nr:TolC family outer membrane protein [Pseudomonas umsongensis]QJC78454.1 TolC family outer membrane protein [Pseudomonas umsongensis]